MGKSSLRVRTMKKLQEDNIACAAIDLTAIGTHKVTPEKWYGGLIKIIVNHFELREKINLRAWLKERNEVTPVQCFCEFIEKILLVEVPQKIVIFIDEIDSVLRLEFKDDFFALIRACYNKRAEKPAYKRLSFVLLGVATPSDLINDKTRTPFNIGRAIELRGFQLDEAKPLIRGMEKTAENAQAVIDEILYWTGGQPFLTQKVCQLVYTSEKIIPAGSEKLYITKLVRKHIIENWESQDEPEHLRTICNRIFRNERLAGRLLGLYQRILLDGQIKNDDSYEQVILLLSGLVVKNGSLKPYNLIYKNVFDLNWVKNALINLQPYSEAINAWLSSNCLDESRLLRGKALQEALDWAKDKSLSSKDYQFLSASQSLEKLELKVALETADKCNDILGKAQQKARRTIRRGLAGLAAISLVTVLITLWGNEIVKDAQKKLELAKKDTQAAKQELKYTKNKAKSLNLSLENTKKIIDDITKKGQELGKRNKAITAEVESAKKRLKVAEYNTRKVQQRLSTTKAELEKSYQDKNLINIELDKVNQEMSKAKEEVIKANATEQKARKQLQAIKAESRKNKEKLKEAISDLEELQNINKNSNNNEYHASGDNQNLLKLNTETIVIDDIDTVNQPYNYEVNLVNKNNNSDINKSHTSTDEVKIYEVPDNCTSIDKLQLDDREELLTKLQTRLKGPNFDNDFITGDFGRTTILIKKLRESKKLSAKGVNCFHSFEVSGKEESKNSERTFYNVAGNGGDLQIISSKLSVTDDSFLSIKNNGEGNAGSLTVNATESIEIDGFDVRIADSSAFYNVAGNGGDLQIISSSLVLSNLDISNSTIDSNILGNAGNIKINSSSLVLRDSAQFSTANNGQVNAGNITINLVPQTPSNPVVPPNPVLESDSDVVIPTAPPLLEDKNFFYTVPTSPTLTSPISYDNSENKSVIELQKFLKDKGFYKGSINGVWNAQTQKALDAFKRYYNID